VSYLAIHGLGKTFGASRVVDGFDLAVARGAFVSLLGPSGSGKTTVLRCIAGFETPDAGAVALDGRVLAERGVAKVPPEARGMGMVFQSYAVWPHLTVAANVAFPLTLGPGKCAPGERGARVAEALARVRLSGFDTRYPHELSGGQQQRVALARAIVTQPKLLLLDEPLSNLDVLLREELATEIKRVARETGLTTLLVTHDHKEALALSDHVVVIDGGRIQAAGAPEALYERPPNDFTAMFLAGGQRLGGASGAASRVYLPRRWRVAHGASGRRVRIETRIFRGNEYEYLARADGWPAPLRFFAAERHEPDGELSLVYDGEGASS
jgi:ABC-type Fe3+/spermidine/putrescine transport system ATPase subunit